jgi:ribosomal protein S18 acetylase RimI-like enzyme
MTTAKPPMASNAAPEFVIRTYEASDEQAVIDLWHRCKLVVPWNDPREDIQTKVAFQPELLFVGTVNGRVVTTVMAGYEGHRGWINYLAVDPDYQRQGIGSAMMLRAEHVLSSLGCPKINLQVRASNQAVIDFYEHLGFSKEERISLGKRLRPQGSE